METLQFGIRPIPLGHQNNWAIVQAPDSSALSLRDKAGRRTGELCTRAAQPPLVRNITPTSSAFITHRTASLILSTRDQNSLFCQINRIKPKNSLHRSSFRQITKDSAHPQTTTLRFSPLPQTTISPPWHQLRCKICSWVKLAGT